MAINKIGGIAALLLGLTSCYNSPEELGRNREDAGINQVADGGGNLALPIKPEYSCREWVIGEEELTVCEYDTDNDGRPDSLLSYSSRGPEIQITKAIDSDGNGTYDQIISRDLILRLPKVEITPKEVPIPKRRQPREIFL